MINENKQTNKQRMNIYKYIREVGTTKLYTYYGFIWSLFCVFVELEILEKFQQYCIQTKAIKYICIHDLCQQLNIVIYNYQQILWLQYFTVAIETNKSQFKLLVSSSLYTTP